MVADNVSYFFVFSASLFMNGDVGGKLQGTVNFPPTPESPQTDYTTVNGSMDGPVQALYTTGSNEPTSPSGN